MHYHTRSYWPNNPERHAPLALLHETPRSSSGAADVGEERRPPRVPHRAPPQPHPPPLNLTRSTSGAAAADELDAPDAGASPRSASATPAAGELAANPRIPTPPVTSPRGTQVPRRDPLPRRRCAPARARPLPVTPPRFCSVAPAAAQDRGCSHRPDLLAAASCSPQQLHTVRYCVEYLYSPVTMRLELYLAVYGRVRVILCNASLLINMRWGLLL
jgi:hypothetical protein